MRFIIGCALSMIFSTNCAYAAAPAEDSATALSHEDVDYGMLVRAEIGKKPASVRPGDLPAKAAEGRAWNAYAVPEQRKAVILPPHRSLQPVGEMSAKIKAVEVPAPVSLKNAGGEKASTVDLVSGTDAVFDLDLSGITSKAAIY